jgi:hypothetical protein
LPGELVGTENPGAFFKNFLKITLDGLTQKTLGAGRPRPALPTKPFTENQKNIPNALNRLQKWPVGSPATRVLVCN